MERAWKKKSGITGHPRNHRCASISSLDQDGGLHATAGFPRSDPMLLSKRITTAMWPLRKDSLVSSESQESIPIQIVASTRDKGDELGDGDEGSIISDVVPTGLRAQRETISILQKENFKLKLSIHSHRKQDAIRDAQLEQTSCALQEAESEKQEMENRLEGLREEIARRYHELERLVAGQPGEDGMEQDVQRGRSKMVKKTRIDKRRAPSNDELGAENVKAQEPTDISLQSLDTINECNGDHPDLSNHQKHDLLENDGPECKSTAIPTYRHILEQGLSKSADLEVISIARVCPVKTKHLIWCRPVSLRKVFGKLKARDLASSGLYHRERLKRLSRTPLRFIKRFKIGGLRRSSRVTARPQHQREGARFFPDPATGQQPHNVCVQFKSKTHKRNIWRNALSKVFRRTREDRISKSNIIPVHDMEDDVANGPREQRYDIEDVDRFKKLLTGKTNKKTGEDIAKPSHASVFRRMVLCHQERPLLAKVGDAELL